MTPDVAESPLLRWVRGLNRCQGHSAARLAATVAFVGSVALAGCSVPAQIAMMMLPDGILSIPLARFDQMPDTVRRDVNALINKGDWPGLQALAERNLALDPSSSPWWYLKGVARWQAGDAKAAEDAFSQSVRLDPYTLEGWHMLAQAQSTQGNHQQAIRTLERSLQVQRDSALTWLLLSEACKRAGLMERSAAAYDEAQRLANGGPRG